MQVLPASCAKVKVGPNYGIAPLSRGKWLITCGDGEVILVCVLGPARTRAGRRTRRIEQRYKVEERNVSHRSVCI